MDFSGSIQYHMKVSSDAAFEKEEEKGHSMRGAAFIRALGSDESSYMASAPGHLLDYVSRAQRHVTRSTFAAELFSACDACDHGILVALMLREISKGVGDRSSARLLREVGGYAMPFVLIIDAMSVYSAAIATNIKIPFDKSLLSHVQFLRECLDRGILKAIIWQDTRDMLADGLTKGAVERTLLHAIMDGRTITQHASKTWTPKKLIKQ